MSKPQAAREKSIKKLVARSFNLAIFPVGIASLAAAIAYFQFVEKDADSTKVIALLGTIALGTLAFVTPIVSNRIAARISQPLEHLRVSAERIASGDFAASLPLAAPAEIDRLTRHFGTMRRKLELRAQTETLVREVTHAVSVGDELTTVFRGFGHAISAAVSFDWALIAFAEEDDLLRLEAFYGSNWMIPAGTSVTPSKALIDAMSNKRTLRLDEVPATEPALALPVEANMGSFVAVPVVVAGKTRLVVGFSASEARRFSDKDVLLLEASVREAAGSLHALLLLGRERRASERLQELDALKNDFVGMVAHDLRSPMNVIAGFADTMLQRWGDLPDKDKLDFLSIMSKSIKELAELVEDVLQVARIESGELAYQLRPFDLPALIEKTRNQVLMAHPGRVCKLDVKTPIPPAVADEQRQWQVLTNLLTNALKFSGNDRPVEVSVRPAGKFIEVSVRDHGIGIKADDISKLFGKFSRVEQPGIRDRVKGTGLGLYISKTLVEAQGGEIRVDSRVGEGTTFSYTVPAADEMEKERANA